MGKNAYQNDSGEPSPPLRVENSETTRERPQEIASKQEDAPQAQESIPTIPSESPLALPNELLIRFANREAMERFEQASQGRGLSILDRSDALLSLRVGYRDAEGRGAIGILAGDDATIDRNYIVVTPTLPESPETTGNRSFENSALDWIGVASDNSEWGKDITIAVLDTGILAHSALNDADIRSVSLVENEAADDRAYNSHGTAIASLLAGEGTGVAPASSLIGIQVMEDNGTGDSFTLARGIVEAVDLGASVISMSLGSYGASSTLDGAISYALDRNVVLVASAGNDSFGALTYPARYEGVIGVSAVDANAQTASFSNFGLGTDIAAPGVGLFAAWNQDEWASFSGTSAATPLVSGSIAALLSLDPRLEPTEAANLLLEYANDAGPAGEDPYYGTGALNIGRVLERDQKGIADASVASIFLDTQSANEGVVPLQLNIENRGTELLRTVTLTLQENDGFPQRIYLGAIPVNETTTHTLYLSESQLESPSGYSVRVETSLGSQSDDHPENDALARKLQLTQGDSED